MQPRIENLKQKKLVGKRLTMSLADNKTGELWKSFMPKRREITNNLTNDLISMQVYKPNHFAEFSPTNEFTAMDRVFTIALPLPPGHSRQFKKIAQGSTALSRI
jgi:hypothetical protein